MAIWLPDKKSWPKGVTDFLTVHHDFFDRWYNRRKGSTVLSASDHRTAKALAERYDETIAYLGDILIEHALRGFHCTRLIDHEIAEIEQNGMSLPNAALLQKRIKLLAATGYISQPQAEKLAASHQADDEYRKDRLWFCFYEPRLAGQGGIEDFLRHWGGEALYRGHASDIDIGPILRRLGTPCIVEAIVPIRGLEFMHGLSMDMARAYVSKSKAAKMVYEHCTRLPVEASSVCRIIRFCEPDFQRLTAYSGWEPPLEA